MARMLNALHALTKSAASLALSLAIGLLGRAAEPVVVIQPYLQPGDGPTLGNRDVKVIRWYTDLNPASFAVEFGVAEPLTSRVRPERTRVTWPETDLLQYTAELTDLPINATIHYRVAMERRGRGESGVATVREGHFATRRSADREVRFFVVGDLASGRPASAAVADQIARLKPEFGVLPGDIVYSSGQVSEYAQRFWPVYNQPMAQGPRYGAALMRTTVFYPVVGNHDLAGFDLDKYPDGLAAFVFFNVPRNGPTVLPSYVVPADGQSWSTNIVRSGMRGFPPLLGKPAPVASFKSMAGPMFPALCNYSFDNGPIHALCLDMSGYVNVDDPTLQEWIRTDLLSSRAPWKLVFFHQPGFNQSKSHWSEQRARRLAPLFESCGVSVVFSGHVHNYQRSHPLRFAPEKLLANGEVKGKFQLDLRFDGRRRTQPDGVIYVVTGGGGANLHDPSFTGIPKRWQRDEGEDRNIMAAFVSDRHTFSMIDAHPDALVLRQVDDRGMEVDHVRITRGPR